MKTPAGLLLLVSTLLLTATAAVAQAAPPVCVSELLYDQQADSLGLARIVGDQRAYIQLVPKVCAPGEKNCLGRSYVVKGDVVVTGGSDGGYTCVVFPNARGGAEGWVPTSRLAALPATPTGGGWTGGWTRDAGASVTLTPAGAEIAVVGEGVWQGPAPGQVHVGDIDGKGRVVDGLLKVGDDICNATLRRIGAYLAVADNNGCGGVNVTFIGIYRRDR